MRKKLGKSGEVNEQFVDKRNAEFTAWNSGNLDEVSNVGVENKI